MPPTINSRRIARAIRMGHQSPRISLFSWSVCKVEVRSESDKLVSYRRPTMLFDAHLVTRDVVNGLEQECQGRPCVTFIRGRGRRLLHAARALATKPQLR